MAVNFKQQEFFELAERFRNAGLGGRAWIFGY
jgi:hypothetical protein